MIIALLVGIAFGLILVLITSFNDVKNINKRNKDNDED